MQPRALCPRLAEAVRENCDGRRVTLVIHDWGSVWGFYLQQFAPHLFKAVVAMDVGPWQLPGTLSNAPKMVAVGLAYQYWLATAHIIGRSSTSDLGKKLGDWMTRAFARRAKQSLGDKAEVTEAITSDAASFHPSVRVCRGTSGTFTFVMVPSLVCSRLRVCEIRPCIKM